MSEVAENGQEVEKEEGEELQVFELYPDLPIEIKLMIVERMRIRDRFRFARSTKLSWNLWAIVTKSQPCSIDYHAGRCYKAITIEYSDNGFWVEEEEEDEENKKKNGFTLQFANFFGTPFIAYYSLSRDRRNLWNIDMDDSFDFLQLGVNHFRKAMQFFENSFSKFSIDDSRFDEKFLEDTVRNLRNLDSIEVFDNDDILQLLLSNQQRPLKELVAVRETNLEMCAHFDKIFQVQGKLEWFYTNLNYEQFLRLKATSVSIQMGNITATEIFDFINSWQNGTYQGDMEECTWDLSLSLFDEHLLCQLLGKHIATLTWSGINLKRKGSTRKAYLFLCGYQLVLRMQNKSHEIPLNDDDEDIFDFMWIYDIDGEE